MLAWGLGPVSPPWGGNGSLAPQPTAHTPLGEYGP